MPLSEETIYEQLCDDFRSLNGILWQTPLIVMTLTGGLWFAVASFDLTNIARSALLAFAAVANVLMIIALYRLRYVMQRIQEQIRTRDGRQVIGPNYVIVTCFAVLLALAATASTFASFSPSIYFKESAAAKEGTS